VLTVRNGSFSPRVRLQLSEHFRDLALFNLAIDSKLRGCELFKFKLKDIAHGSHILKRAITLQQKTHKPVQFEITEKTCKAISDWIIYAGLSREDYMFKKRIHHSLHISTKQYARIL
jgi:integrase